MPEPAAIVNGIPFSDYAIALGILTLILLAVHMLALGSSGLGKGLAGLVLGADGRTSTSKLSAALWTLAILYAFAVLMVDGRTFVDSLKEEYLLLLGGPFAAAIGAKAITTNKLAIGREVKEPPVNNRKRDRLAEIVSNDQGEVDLGDFQYFAFTLLTITFFLIAFVKNPVGLPDLPDTLVGLSTVSASAYLTKKVAISEPSEVLGIVSVRPTRIVLGETRQLVISGSGFLKNSEGGDGNAVLLDGVDLETKDWSKTSVKAELVGWAENGLEENQQAELVVHDDSGRPSKPFQVRVLDRVS